MKLQDEIKAVFIEWLNEDVIVSLKDEMNKLDINASRELTQSLHIGKATIDDNDVLVEMLMNSYWKYVNYGVNGLEVNHGAPTHGKAPKGEISFKQAILEWIPQRGYLKPDGFKTYDDWAFAIMQGIRKKGHAPRPFVNNTLNKLDTKNLTEKIVKIYANNIRQENGNNGN